MVICFVFSWLTLNRIEFAMKDMRRLSRAGSLASRRTESDPRLYKLRPWIVWPGGTSIFTLQLLSGAVNLTVQIQDRETAQVVRGSRINHHP